MNFKSQLLLWIATFMVTSPGSAQGQYFSDQPIWRSGTSASGGDGIARFIDFDRDGDMDVLTS